MKHTIPPVFDKNSKVLVLGSFPSPKSREIGFFYGHRQNRFWEVIAKVFEEAFPETVEERREFLLRRGIAMWDVCASCDIIGASDSSIKNVVPNDFSEIFATADIRAVFCTGKTSHKLSTKLCEEKTGMRGEYLPSTSAANRAGYDVASLVSHYKKIRYVIENENIN